MKEVRNKRLVLAGLAVLALLLAGAAAIAIFRDTLQAAIRVETGNVSLRFVGNPSAVDNEPRDLDIARCSASLNPNNPKQLSVQIENAYPGYNCTVSVSVRNVGTIHARFEREVINVSHAALSVRLVRAPEGVIAPNADANVSFVVSVTGQAEQNKQYNATVQFIFRQALP